MKGRDVSDSWYHIETRDWPVVRQENELSADQILAVLDEVSTYYRGAMESLADTTIPTIANPGLPPLGTYRDLNLPQ